VDLAPTVSVSSEFGTYTLTFNFNKGTLHGKREFINRKKIITPSEYKAFKEFYNKVYKIDDKDIFFKKGK
jgi:hypothetical protein